MDLFRGWFLAACRGGGFEGCLKQLEQGRKFRTDLCQKVDLKDACFGTLPLKCMVKQLDRLVSWETRM